MKIYFGYAIPTKNTFSIAEVDATYIEHRKEYELCKPIFDSNGSSTRYVETRKLDNAYSYTYSSSVDEILISLDQEKVERFVTRAFNEKMEELRELEKNGIQRFRYEAN